jgi:hypothetical protein
LCLLRHDTLGRSVGRSVVRGAQEQR